MVFKGWKIIVCYLDVDKLNTIIVHDSKKLCKTDLRKKIGKKKIVSVQYDRETYSCKGIGKVLECIYE